MEDLNISEEVIQPVSEPKKNPFLALFLSIVPGLGQLYLGEKTKAMTFLFMVLGVVVGIITSESLVMKFCIGLIYIFVFFPAAKDAWVVARRGQKSVTGNESAIYVLMMLAFVGPFALPLLWQNKKMPVFAKILLTLFVLMIVLLFILAAFALGHFYESIIAISDPAGANA